jgi:2,4-dienoyl-CoA reductase-like NADH-dependent reductase (Old Yellow Enzyme family)/threonine dehydrogenase-like Zn-dependent dehydrogenase
LLRPFQLKHLTLRNRLMSTAHEPSFSEDGMPKDRYRLYHVEKAKGGIALTMTAGSAVVSPDSPPVFGNLLAYKDEIVPWMRRLSDDCHAHGAAVMIQLTHLESADRLEQGRLAAGAGTSPVREPAHRAFPKAVEDWDVERIVADYAAAAQRMQAAGLMASRSKPMAICRTWFSRRRPINAATNTVAAWTTGCASPRTDAVRVATGSAFIVGIRMVADEDWDIGLPRAEGIEIARRLVLQGRWTSSTSSAVIWTPDVALRRVIPIHGMPAAPHLDFAGEVRAGNAVSGVPCGAHPGRGDGTTRDRRGQARYGGMTRAHIADPHIGRRLMEGREHEIRPCVGATYCPDRIYEGNDAVCVHNPTTGREATMPHVIARSDGPRRKVVVVGAGPAGLEAARVSAARGHDVVVFEAAERPGGQVLLAGRAPRRKELIGIIDWRMQRLADHGAALRFSTYAHAADVLAESPDIVFVATGGVPNTDVLESGGDLVMSTWDVLSGAVTPAQRVLVYDDNGAHPAMQAAELLAVAGSAVEIVTPERYFAPEIGGLNHAAYAEVFHRHGVRITINARLRSVRREGNAMVASIGSDHGPERFERMIDRWWSTRHPARYRTGDALRPLSLNLGEVDYAALIAGRSQTVVRNPNAAFRLFRIGDAVASRNIHAAIYDALRLGKDL